MTREEIKSRAELYSALIDGKAIQVQNPETSEWKYIDINKFDGFAEGCNYRIKPEPMYRPFESKEECWDEMHKHPDFGWVKYKVTGTYDIISSIYNTTIIDPTKLSIDGFEYTLRESFNNFCFTDGTPFGIKEE